MVLWLKTLFSQEHYLSANLCGPMKSFGFRPRMGQHHRCCRCNSKCLQLPLKPGSPVRASRKLSGWPGTAWQIQVCSCGWCVENISWISWTRKFAFLHFRLKSNALQCSPPTRRALLLNGIWLTECLKIANISWYDMFFVRRVVDLVYSKDLRDMFFWSNLGRTWPYHSAHPCSVWHEWCPPNPTHDFGRGHCEVLTTSYH